MASQGPARHSVHRRAFWSHLQAAGPVTGEAVKRRRPVKGAHFPVCLPRLLLGQSVPEPISRTNAPSLISTALTLKPFAAFGFSRRPSLTSPVLHGRMKRPPPPHPPEAEEPAGPVGLGRGQALWGPLASRQGPAMKAPFLLCHKAAPATGRRNRIEFPGQTGWLCSAVQICVRLTF